MKPSIKHNITVINALENFIEFDNRGYAWISNELIEWLDDNCHQWIFNGSSDNGRLRFPLLEETTEISFYFDSKEDAILFKLRWG